MPPRVRIATRRASAPAGTINIKYILPYFRKNRDWREVMSAPRANVGLSRKCTILLIFLKTT